MSFPSALFARFQMLNGKCKALVWLPSNEGKKYYPMYDLTFLHILFGYFNVRLFVKDGFVVSVIVCKTVEQLNSVTKIVGKYYDEIEDGILFDNRLPVSLQ